MDLNKRVLKFICIIILFYFKYQLIIIADGEILPYALVFSVCLLTFKLQLYIVSRCSSPKNHYCPVCCSKPIWQTFVLWDSKSWELSIFLPNIFSNNDKRSLFLTQNCHITWEDLSHANHFYDTCIVMFVIFGACYP